MPNFTEANTIENVIRDVLTGQTPGVARQRELREPYGLHWRFVATHDLPRTEQQVMVEPWLREALFRLNPEIAAQPDHADDVIHRLRGILLSAANIGLVRANEQFTSWLRGEHSMPFGPGGQHVPVRLIDFEHPERNRFVVTQQYTYKPTPTVERRMDLVLLVNGLPLVIGEVKSPVRPSVSWADGAKDFMDDYWRTVPALFVPNVFCFASEGREYRYAAVGADFQGWAPWRATEDRAPELPSLAAVLVAVERMLPPPVVLDLLDAFVVFPAGHGGRKVKVIGRYQQYEAARQIVARVVEGKINRGLIWHFQGSGKSLLMVFAAQLLKAEPALKNPTVLIIVDRKDLRTQLGTTFDAADVPNTLKIESRKDLEQALRSDTRQIIITTIHLFADVDGALNDRRNIIALVDEAHRTQEGDLGRKMRQALPNAFLFGLTGTPIARRDRNTFAWFGAPEDADRYLNHYSYQQAVRDEATLPVQFEPRLVSLRVDREAIDAGFEALASSYDLDLAEKAALSQRAGKLAHLLKAPQRMRSIADDITAHFRERIEPSGLKGMVVVYDRESCVIMYHELAQRLGEDAVEIVMITQDDDLEKWRKRGTTVRDEDYERWAKLNEDSAALELLLNHYRDPAYPLQLLIVTSKLLTGFDAPICQAMYLDKPLRDHTLLQAICRTNRRYANKSYGLVVDYLGVFDDAGKALDFDPKDIEGAIQALKNLCDQFAPAIAQTLSYFPDVDRSVAGYEGLMAAQDCLKTNERRDAFAADYLVVSRLWEILSPEPSLSQYEADYRWLSQVYESIRPVSGIGTLIWQALGPKTLELIHQNVAPQTIIELDTVIIGAEEALTFDNKDEQRKRANLLHMTIARKLRTLGDSPRFKALGERLEQLKDQYELGIIESIIWLKSLLQTAREVVQVQNETKVQLVDDGKQALTQIFLECKVEKTPEIIGNIVSDIDQIVRATRFDGWQQTVGGDKQIQKALRQTLLKYQLHKEQELFEKAYAYIRENY